MCLPCLKALQSDCQNWQLESQAAGMKCCDSNLTANMWPWCLLLQALVYEEKGGNSVAWNSQLEDMLCFSGSGQLTIKNGDFQAHVQKMQGFVVGFKVLVADPHHQCPSARVSHVLLHCCISWNAVYRTTGQQQAYLHAPAHITVHKGFRLKAYRVCVLMQGSKVFCLQYNNVATIDIPQGGSMSHFLERNDIQEAYRVACLGVTEADWRALAQAALQVCVAAWAGACADVWCPAGPSQRLPRACPVVLVMGCYACTASCVLNAC